MASAPTILVTGGAGFIGSNFVLDQVARGTRVINLDALTYAGNLANLATLIHDPAHVFVHGDICDAPLVTSLLATYQPDALVHFAAESHVDRSILDAAAFLRTNVSGTHALLECASRYWSALAPERANRFRFVHISTDEVYGSLAPTDPPFDEASPYRPNSPYAATKAAADHLARAYHQTFGLPVVTTHCSNNYGPLQFPEKLVPFMLLRALERTSLPVYGDGLQVRDWLHVDDHVAAIELVTRLGRPGEVYAIGGNAELTNLDVVRYICDLVDEKRPDQGSPRRDLITFVADRPGHDRRYAIDASKIRRELGWAPRETFASGLARTVDWYLANAGWVETIRTGEYRRWIETNYAARTEARP